jgi:arachidonate 15-lipoxygenase
MAIPTLPQNDPQPDLRSAGLAADRALVDFNRTQHGIVRPSAVPEADQFSFRWDFEAESLAIGAELEGEFGAWQVAADDTRTPGERWRSLAEGLLHDLERPFTNQGRPIPFIPLPWQAREPLTIAEHALLCGELPRTESVSRWDDDAFFARQRIASDCNGLLTLVTERDWPLLKQRIPLSEDLYAKVVPGDSLSSAVDEHRLLVCDLSILDGIDPGYYGEWRRWLPAPIALFALERDRCTLRPVAIQCAQTPGVDNPILTPLDDVAWRMARACYNGAESTYHGVVEHGAHCHLMMGAIAVATHRCLARNHPVRVLLTPHLEMTMAIARATGDLYVPGGRTPSLQSISVDGIAKLTERCWQQFNWYECSLDRHFGHRGLASSEVMKEMPVRDDLALYVPVIREFVQTYVHLYYPGDADVYGDAELQQWVRTVQDRKGADIPSFGAIKSRVDILSDLIDTLASIIWRTGPWHAVVNYPVYDTTAFAPAYPSALFAPPPRLSHKREEDLLSLLPPEAVVRGLFVDLVQVSNLRINRLGHYGPECFEDARVHGLLDRFQLDLDGVARRIAERNRFRAIPYPFLDPALVPASIHI